MPQGSVFGPVLFLIYVNDIDQGITYMISVFADDTKIMDRVTTTAEKTATTIQPRHFSQLVKKQKTDEV